VPEEAKEKRKVDKKEYMEEVLPNGDVVRLPNSANSNFTHAFHAKKLTVSCGYLKKDVPFLIWDSIPMCDPEKCVASAMCSFTNMEGRKCTVQVKYLQRAYTFLCDKVKASVDAVQMMDIGFNLMVLYGHLIKFKLVEASLGHNVTGFTAKGGVYVHPIYSEIRKVLKDISQLQKEIFSVKEGAALAGDLDDYMHGDPTFYEQIIPKGSFASNNEVKLARKKG